MGNSIVISSIEAAQLRQNIAEFDRLLSERAYEKINAGIDASINQTASLTLAKAEQQGAATLTNRKGETAEQFTTSMDRMKQTTIARYDNSKVVAAAKVAGKGLFVVG